MISRTGEDTDTIRVLHVDDEPDLAELAAIYLERENDQFDIKTATSANAGLTCLADTMFDCVISDYDMPGQSGIEFLEAVREDYPDLPFILYTGKGSEEVASEAIAAGATDYLQKESGTDQYTVLANRVQNAVAQYRSQRRADEHQRITKVIRDLNRALVYADSVDEIEHEVCEILSDAEPYLTACIADVDTDTMQIEPRTWAGDAAGYFDALEMSVADGSPGRHAPGGRAYHERDIAISQNLSGDPQYEQWRDAATERGFQSLAVVPLEYDDALYGLLAVFADRPYAFDETEQELLTELGDDIAHAVQAREVRSALRTRTRAMDEAPVGITVTDPNKPDNPLVYVNDEFTEMTGYGMDEVLDKNHRFLQGPDSDDEPVAAIRDAIDNEERLTVELRNYRKNGEQFWNRASIAPVYDDEDTLTNYVGFQQDITDRKESEQESRRSERRFEAMFNDPNILVGLLDTDGTVRDINETAMEYIEATVDDLRGNPFWKTPWFKHSDTVQQEMQDWIDRATDGEYVEFEADLVRPNGDPYTVEGVFRPVTDEDGEVVSLLVSDRDITAQRERETALEQTNALLSTLIETLPVGVLAEDTDRDVLVVNEQLMELFGIPDSPDEVVGADCERMAKDISELFTDPAGFGERINEVIAHRDPVFAEELTLQDGRTFTRTYEPIELPTGDGHLWVYRDVTFQTEQEARLKALNKTSQELMAASTRTEVAEIGVEAARDILDLEANAVHLYDDECEGLVPVAQTALTEELVGEAPTFTDGDSIAWRVYESGEALALDNVHDDPDIKNPDSPVQSEVYVPIGNYGVLLSASKTPEAFGNRDVLLGELLAGNMATALGEIDRTKQLRDRERNLEQQNERLEEFASVVSHDLRNPLRVAEGNLEIVRETCDSERIETIDRALTRMDELIEDLLQLACEGDQVSNTETVDLAELVEDCWQNVATATAILRTDIDWTIQADRSRLAQLLENLIRNAIEHGGQDVTITVGEFDEGFYIEDNGPGIPESEREDVFEAGYSTTEEGTGFGLAIVKRVANAHEWEIRITDGAEGGARFEVTGV